MKLVKFLKLSYFATCFLFFLNIFSCVEAMQCPLAQNKSELASVVVLNDDKMLFDLFSAMSKMNAQIKRVYNITYNQQNPLILDVRRVWTGDNRPCIKTCFRLANLYYKMEINFDLLAKFFIGQSHCDCRYIFDSLQTAFYEIEFYEKIIDGKYSKIFADRINEVVRCFGRNEIVADAEYQDIFTDKNDIKGKNKFVLNILKLSLGGVFTPVSIDENYDELGVMPLGVHESFKKILSCLGCSSAVAACLSGSREDFFRQAIIGSLVRKAPKINISDLGLDQPCEDDNSDSDVRPCVSLDVQSLAQIHLASSLHVNHVAREALVSKALEEPLAQSMGSGDRLAVYVEKTEEPVEQRLSIAKRKAEKKARKMAEKLQIMKAQAEEARIKVERQTQEAVTRQEAHRLAKIVADAEDLRRREEMERHAAAATLAQPKLTSAVELLPAANTPTVSVKPPRMRHRHRKPAAVALAPSLEETRVMPPLATPVKTITPVIIKKSPVRIVVGVTEICQNLNALNQAFLSEMRKIQAANIFGEDLDMRYVIDNMIHIRTVCSGRLDAFLRSNKKVQTPSAYNKFKEDVDFIARSILMAANALFHSCSTRAGNQDYALILRGKISDKIAEQFGGDYLALLNDMMGKNFLTLGERLNNEYLRDLDNARIEEYAGCFRAQLRGNWKFEKTVLKQEKRFSPCVIQ